MRAKTVTAAPTRRQPLAAGASVVRAKSASALTAHTWSDHAPGPTLVSHGTAPAAGLAAALKKLTWHMGESLRGIRIIACTRATDVYPTNRLAIAAAKSGAAVVIGSGDTTDVVVPTGTPGCVDAMWQACGHAVDVRAGSPSNDPQFRAALASSSRAVEKHYGACSPAEAFALSFADYATDEADLKSTIPALHRYWLQVSSRMCFAWAPTPLRELEGSPFKLVGDAATELQAIERVTAALKDVPPNLVELVLSRGYRFLVAGESPEVRFPDAGARRHAAYDAHIIGKYISLHGYSANSDGVRVGIGLAVDAIFKVSSNPAYVALVGKAEDQFHGSRFHDLLARYLAGGPAGLQSEVAAFFAAAKRAGWDFSARPASRAHRSAGR